jgi:hypothetical protein
VHGPSTCRIADPIVHEYTHAPGPTRRVRCRSEHVPPGRPPYSYWGRARTLVVDVLALHIMSASAASPASPSDPSLLPNISHRVLSIVRRPLNTQCQHSLPIASAVSRDVRERILCVFRWQHGAAAPQHHSITRICCAAQLSVMGIMHMSVSAARLRGDGQRSLLPWLLLVCHAPPSCSLSGCSYRVLRLAGLSRVRSCARVASGAAAVMRMRIRAARRRDVSHARTGRSVSRVLT